MKKNAFKIYESIRRRLIKIEGCNMYNLWFDLNSLNGEKCSGI